MQKTTKKGILLATAATLLITSQGFAQDSNTTKAKVVKCYGVNSCQGKGQCGNKTHSCSGQNGCKGKGWLYLSPDTCKAKNGKV